MLSTKEKDVNFKSFMFIICIFPFGDGVSDWICLYILQILPPENILHPRVIYSTESSFFLPKSLSN